MRSCIGTIICLLSTVALAGCGSSHNYPDLVPVSGKITIDGTPTAGLKVSFEPNEGRRSSGITNQSGEYVLHYMDTVKGATPGQHRVTIVWIGETDENIEGDSIPTDDPGKTSGLVIPSRYNAQSQLTAVVNSEATRFDFDLKARSR